MSAPFSSLHDEPPPSKGGGGRRRSRDASSSRDKDESVPGAERKMRRVSDGRETQGRETANTRIQSVQQRQCHGTTWGGRRYRWRGLAMCFFRHPRCHLDACARDRCGEVVIRWLMTQEMRHHHQLECATCQTFGRVLWSPMMAWTSAARGLHQARTARPRTGHSRGHSPSTR